MNDQRTGSPQDASGIFRAALRYVLHLLAATFLSSIIAAVLVVTILPFIQLVNPDLTRTAILFHRHFPVQVCVALAAGYIGSSRSKSWSPLWVWVLPAAFLALNLYLWKPPSVFEDRWAGAFDYFFAWDCEWPYCARPLMTTLPFYTSLAYTVGAIFDRANIFRFQSGSQGTPPDRPDTGRTADLD